MPIKFKKAKIGPENDLVNKFLKHYRKLFKTKGLEVTVLQEPFAEIGIPDILLVVWDKAARDAWHPDRNILQKDDIKILHFISGFGRRGVTIEGLCQSLSYDCNQVMKTVERLLRADIIAGSGNLIRIKNFKKHFFIRQIISIEAKMNNWREAMQQAQLNQNFSSHSYVLLPEKKITSDILSACDKKMGVLSFGSKPVLMKRAIKSKLPGSYYSWMLNEYVGRQISESNF